MSLSITRNDLLPGLQHYLVPYKNKLEGSIDVRFDLQELLLQIYNVETKKLVKKELSMIDIEQGKFPTIMRDAVKEALGEG